MRRASHAGAFPADNGKKRRDFFVYLRALIAAAVNVYGGSTIGEMKSGGGRRKKKEKTKRENKVVEARRAAVSIARESRVSARDTSRQ